MSKNNNFNACTVQCKISCVFKTEVCQIPSTKRAGQNYKVVATKDLSIEAASSNVLCSNASEKFDGTCCFVSSVQGHPSLFARLDRKPNKKADKRFKKYQMQKRELISNGNKGELLEFVWNLGDMKEVPDLWIPADLVQRDEQNNVIPDSNGHIPGWVPITVDQKQYCWHHSVVRGGIALVLRTDQLNRQDLEIVTQPLALLDGQTLELIGTNINGNPYEMGSKRCPLHVLIRHGSIPVPLDLDGVIDFDRIRHWFQSQPQGAVEGIVWHCADGKMFKLHRHHVDLPWPPSRVDDVCDDLPTTTHLARRRVTVRLESEYSPFEELSKIDGESFSSLRHLSLRLTQDAEV